MFKKKNLNEVSKEQMESNISALNAIYNRAKELERRNQLLKAKYDNDEKYARLHKRLMEKAPLTDSESKLFEALKGLKAAVDIQIQQNARLLDNENFIKQMIPPIIFNEFEDKQGIDLEIDSVDMINQLVVREYMNEYHGLTGYQSALN